MKPLVQQGEALGLLPWEQMFRDALLATGRRLFEPMLQQRIDQIGRAYQPRPNGRPMGRRLPVLATLFGEVRIRRDYYLVAEGSGHCPAAAALGPEGSATPALARLITGAASQQPNGAAGQDLAEYGTSAAISPNTVDEQFGFLERHQHRMLYGSYRSQGWFIGSGVVEARSKRHRQWPISRLPPSSAGAVADHPEDAERFPFAFFQGSSDRGDGLAMVRYEETREGVAAALGFPKFVGQSMKDGLESGEFGKLREESPKTPLGLVGAGRGAGGPERRHNFGDARDGLRHTKAAEAPLADPNVDIRGYTQRGAIDGVGAGRQQGFAKGEEGVAKGGVGGLPELAPRGDPVGEFEDEDLTLLFEEVVAFEFKGELPAQSQEAGLGGGQIGFGHGKWGQAAVGRWCRARSSWPTRWSSSAGSKERISQPRSRVSAMGRFSYSPWFKKRRSKASPNSR